MVEIGNASGAKTVIMLTDVDQPSGSAVGNTLGVVKQVIL